MSRPSHSAQRDAAWGQFYGRRGAWAAIVQAERGGTARDNAMRTAHWRNKVAQLPLDILHKDVPIGAGVVLNFNTTRKRLKISP